MQRVEWQRIERGLKGCAAAILFLSLAGCLSPLKSDYETGGVGPGDAVDPARNADLVAHYPRPAGGEAVLTGAVPPPQIFPGAGAGPVAPDRFSSNSPGDDAQSVARIPADAGPDGPGVEINFDNADIQTVAKSVLSDTLGMNVVIDPRIQGNVTIVSSAPIPRKDLLSAFESVLRMSNAAVVRDGNLVKIVPLPEAAGAGGKLTLRPGEAGFGVTIVPLRYASAATIAKTSESFLSRPGALRADTTRNILMIQGTAAERQSAVEMITSFDVEWLRNQSVGIYPLKATSPDTMIHELERVFETAEGGQGQGMINFQPIARMNAVMAVSRSRKYIDQTSQWIRRLDKSDPTGTTIRIYRLEHGAAVKIAKILNDIFVGKGGAQAADNAANQVAPGSNAGQSKLDSLGGGLNSSGTATNNTSNTAISNNSPQPNSSLTNNSSGLTASSFDDFSGGSKKSGDNGGELGGALPKGVFQNVRITADAANNPIVIFSNQEDYNVIERSLRELDRPQMQVAIEATIAEVTLTDALQYGVQYYIGSSNIGAGTNNGSISLTTSAATAAIAQAVPGLNLPLGNQASPRSAQRALHLEHRESASAPSLVVTDNQPAFLQVGDSVPISTGSATVLSSSNTVVNTITMQDTGVILKVWPHIHANGVVELEIEQQVSNVVGGVSANTTNLNPTISQRRIYSTVAVTSGQTVLLGGLMSEEDDKTKSGIPLLQQIRGIGDLFGTTNGSKSRTEIIVFVKPRIIQNSLDAQNVAQDFRAGLSTMHSNATMFSGRDVPDPRPIPPK